MSSLTQGCIIRANVFDQRGRNPKVRPLVVVTATSELTSSSSFFAVAIAGRFSEPLADDEVMLPWHRDGLSRTRLCKPCVANCSWLCEIKEEDVVEIKGVVPPVQMEKIVEIVREL